MRPRLPRPTIRLRLTLLYGALFLASGAAVLSVTYVLVRNETGNVFVKSTNGTVGGVAYVSQQAGTGPTEAGPTTQIVNGVPALSQAQLSVQAGQLESQAKHQRAAELRQLLVDSGIALGAMAIMSIVLGWIVAGRVLRPLRTITSAARRISVTSLHERLALSGPDDELKELGDTVDGLLARLESSFRTQRQVVANASHELRTPLARQRTLIQVALADPDVNVDSLRAAYERVLVSGAEQERLIEGLIALSRGQAGLDRRAPIDLARVADEVLLVRNPDVVAPDVRVHAMLTPAPTTGDLRLVERLVANLVDNALRHNVERGWVEIATGTRGDDAFVSVVNTGPDVPETAIERLLQPFRRLGPDRSGKGDGLGLGLSIIQAIADAHDASLTIRPRPNGGLEVEVRFPTAPVLQERVDRRVGNEAPVPLRAPLAAQYQ